MAIEKKLAVEKSSKDEFSKRFKNKPGIFIGTVIVLVLVIVSFVLVPAIVPDSRGGLSAEQMAFGYWDGKPIAYTGGSYLLKVRERIIRQAQYNAMYQNNARMPQEQEVLYQAFNATVVRMAALETMRRANYVPPDSFVNKSVAQLPDFQENGRFSTLRYEQYPVGERLSLWNETKDDLIAERFREDIMDIAVSSKEAVLIGNMSKNQRKFMFASIPFDTYPDNEVVAYVQKNVELFKVLHLSQITIKDEVDAKKVHENIKNGSADFAETAESQSIDNYKSKSGDAGVRNAFEFDNVIKSEENRAKLSSLKKGDISDVFEAYSGWVFFRAEEDPKDAATDDVALLNKTRSYMLSDERGLVEEYFISRAKELNNRAKDSSFESAAAVLDIKVDEFGPLPINYGDIGLFNTLAASNISTLSGDASRNANFWKTAFSTAVGTPSEPIVLSGMYGDFIAVIYPTEAITEDTDALEGVKTTYISYWAQELTAGSAEKSIFNSPKFENNFFATFSRLRSQGYFQ
ncbi:MAG: hypothetical protein Ta2B_04000 [Termitinemataceae bacterium]|nr:MAG: hypothetical protein Ta2B_04000 [Termitinemataceae bacterium]